jgi:hypothetical protein
MISLMGEQASSFSKDRWWLVANVIGAAAYVWLSSWTWLEPELRGKDVGSAGAAMVWAMSALPVLVGFALVDLVWLIRRLRSGQSLQPILLAAPLWAVVLGICRALS